jgi:hypothetical protein
MKYYAGIGSRETPPEVCASMTRLALYLAAREWCLRSGGAKGADEAFEQVLYEVRLAPAQIYLPWRGFNGRGEYGPYKVAGDWTWAREIACKHYPRLRTRYDVVQRFMTRNVAILLGGNADGPGEPVDFAVCWTPNGDICGGTGRAIVVARAYDIPVYNLAVSGVKELLWERIKS